MTVADLMNECRESGVSLGTDAQGGLSCRGDQKEVARLLPAIRKHKDELLELLMARSNDERIVEYHTTLPTTGNVQFKLAFPWRRITEADFVTCNRCVHWARACGAGFVSSDPGADRLCGKFQENK